MHTQELTLHPIEFIIQILFQQYLNNSYCVTFMSENYMIDLIDIPDGVSVVVLNSTVDILEATLYASEMGCLDYVVQMEDPEKFLIIFDKVVRLGNARKSNRKIILLPPFGDDDEFKLLGVLKLKETSFVSNLLLVIPVNANKECKTFDFVTNKFTGHDFETNKPILLDKWNSCTNEFERKANLFPDKMKDLKGKTIKVACFHIHPFSLLDLDNNSVPYGRDGLEIRAVHELCRWINCTVGIVRDDNAKWGNVYDNGTGEGVMGNVYMDRADLAIGGLGAWFYVYQKLAMSVYGIKCSITVIVPAPQLASLWQVPLLALSAKIWLLYFFGGVFASFALYMANNYSTRHIFLLPYRISLAQAQSDHKNPNWRIRRITFWILLTIVIINSAYSAGLATNYTIQKYEDSIDTVKDVVDRNMEWGALHEAYIYTLINSQDPVIRGLVKLFRKYNAKEMMQKSYSNNMAFAIIKLQGDNINVGTFLNKDVVSNYMILLEDIYYEFSLIMGRKSSPLLDKMNELLLRFHETGLTLAWENQVSLWYPDYKVQLAIKFSRLKKESKTGPLGYYHLEGIFYMYIGGIILSASVFVMEIMSFQIKRKYT